MNLKMILGDSFNELGLHVDVPRVDKVLGPVHTRALE